jgi:hypothetical protein
MQRVASRIPVSEYEPAAGVVELVEWGYAEPHLIEDGDEVNRVRDRAVAVINTTRVRHMGFVIRRVNILPIPAAREEYLCSETIRTIRVASESWCLRHSRAVEIDT